MIAHFSFKNHHLNDTSFLTLHPSLQQLSHRLSAFVLLSFCKFCMLLGATLLYGGHYLESAVAADFLQCPDGSAALVHQYIERPGCGGGAQQRTALASLQWQRETHDILAHQSIHHTVKKQLERAGDIAPVAGRCHHKGIGSAYHGKHTLSIVLGQHTPLICAAAHAAHTRFYAEAVHFHHLYLSSLLQGFCLYRFHHLRDVSLGSRTGIEYQQILPFHHNAHARLGFHFGFLYPRQNFGVQR